MSLVWLELLRSMPYEPSLARALAAHEMAVRRGPDPGQVLTWPSRLAYGRLLA
jgi:hypothetical protein